MTIQTVIVRQGDRILCEVWQTEGIYIRSIREEIFNSNRSNCSSMVAFYCRKQIDDICLAICYKGSNIDNLILTQLEQLIQLYTNKCIYENYGLQDELALKIKSIINSQKEKSHSIKNVTEALQNIEAEVTSQVNSVMNRGEQMKNLEHKSEQLKLLSQKYLKESTELHSLASLSSREIIIGMSVLLIIIYLLLSI